MWPSVTEVPDLPRTEEDPMSKATYLKRFLLSTPKSTHGEVNLDVEFTSDGPHPIMRVRVCDPTIHKCDAAPPGACEDYESYTFFSLGEEAMSRMEEILAEVKKAQTRIYGFVGDCFVNLEGQEISGTCLEDLRHTLAVNNYNWSPLRAYSKADPTKFVGWVSANEWAAAT